jgi:hypothetical protein
MAAVADEAKALEQDAARQSAIERERAILGLEPRIESLSPAETMETTSSTNQAEPESIYASQFASMAAIMENILGKSHSSFATDPCHSCFGMV